MLSLIVLGSISIVTIVLIVTAIAHVFVATPYGGTPPEVVRAMVRLAALRPGDHVVDIGAGDGRILVEAKRRMPSIDATGYEIALAIWMLGKLRITFSGMRVRLLLRNALRCDLSSTDVLFLYVGPEMMRRLLPKLREELKPGTRIISHTFHLPEHVPVREEFVRVRARQKRVMLYEW